MSDFHRYDTYNPSTGLPMAGGGVDVGGYAIGQSYWDRHRAPTSSFNSNTAGSMMNHGYSSPDYGTFRPTALDGFTTHQDIANHFHKGAHGSGHDIHVPRTRAGQIAVTIFGIGVFSIAAGSVILGFIGVF